MQNAINFLRDFVDLTGIRSTARPNSKSDEKLLFDYCQLIHKKIPRLNWKIKKSSKFNLDISSDIKACIEKIEDDASNGRDLSKYCSTRLENASFHDKLLNDWNIYHLHPGHGQKKTKDKSFVNRSKELIYVTYSEDTLYFIDILGHNSFCEVGLLKIIHNEWQYLLSEYVTPVAKLNYEISDKNDVSKFRELNINSIITIGGTHYMGMGGGLCANGANSEASDEYIYILQALKCIEHQIKTECNEKSKDANYFKLIDISEDIWKIIDNNSNHEITVNWKEHYWNGERVIYEFNHYREKTSN